jgi:aminoglycoside phosphotransferase (APT) family kinase protein
MLSALATSAVPGFQVVSAQNMSSAERDQALVHDVSGQPFVITLPRTAASEKTHQESISAAKALTDGLRSRLPFGVPRVLGVLDVGGMTLSVTEYLPGQPVQAKNVTPAIASSIGQALAHIHQLPTSTLMDNNRRVENSLDTLRSAAGVVDLTAATGLIPQSLLRRWEAALEDAALWHFEATVIHHRMALKRILIDQDACVAVLGWREFRLGDPAWDLAWLTTPTSSGFAQQVINAYQQARPSTDRWFLQRARFHAELDIARWLLHGREKNSDSIVSDATEMLVALNDRVSHDIETALTQPISQQQHPLSQ